MLVAIDPDQNDHAAFADALASHRGPLVISPFVVAELDYMIARDYGGDARLAFLDEVDRGAYRLEAFGAADFSRARTLMDAYSHLTGFGIADASNVVLAEPWRSPGGALRHHGYPHYRSAGLPSGRALRRSPFPHPPLRPLTVLRRHPVTLSGVLRKTVGLPCRPSVRERLRASSLSRISCSGRVSGFSPHP
jgi:uncharacterized protein